MRNNKDKWAFYVLPSRKRLSAAEVMHWKNTLKKILKIGMEFEFNLPEKKNGTCKGDNNTCPCVHLKPENDCWQKCINSNKCAFTKKTIENCVNVTNTCEEADCSSCEHFKSKCEGIYCPNFISACIVCDNYRVDCKNCKYLYDPSKNPDAIRKSLNNELRPNNTYGTVGKTGVHSITTDGSLLGKKGAEIITVGRRVDYWEFYKMSKNIIDKAVEKGAYMNERCSIHMHLLASYYNSISGMDNGMPNKVNEMEKNMPELILANLHQLVRRYQNAMTWMIMGLEDPDKLTRWEKFRVSVLPISAVRRSMIDVRDEVSNEAGGSKYGWINYNQLGFSKNGDVNRFHVEFRAADGLLSPSAVSAIGCMYYALMIKAIEISRFGLLEIGNAEWLEHAQKIKDALLNNRKSYKDGDRFCDTSNLYKYYDELAEESMDLVCQLKSILIKIGPAYEVLEKLAEKPCALRRVDGVSWKDIEEELQVIVNKEDIVDIRITEILTLNQITECKDESEWIEEVGALLRESEEVNLDEDVHNKIENYIMNKKEDGELVWSKKIGAPILI